MKNKFIRTVLSLLAILALAACSGLKLPGVSQETEPSTKSSGAAIDPAAMSVDMKLAVGTLMLEDTDLAVDAQQAKELLPLWKAVKSLSASQTASQDEIQALYRQIETTMTPEQIRTIEEMKFDQESLRASVEELGIEMPQFGAQGDFGNLSEDERASMMNQFQVQNPGGMPGGFEGGAPGEMPGGGANAAPPEGGFPQQGNAQRESGADTGRRMGGMNMMFIDPLIQLLQGKVGS